MSRIEKTNPVPKGIFYIPVHRRFFLFLTTLLGIVLTLLFLEVIGTAFKKLFPGLDTKGIFILLVACLLGSYVNLPIMRLKTQVPIVRARFVRVLGIVYPIPSIEMKSSETLLAINLGGALIPTIASIYLMSKTSFIALNAIIATLFVALIVRTFSRPVRGLGITIPSFIPPLAAILPGILIGDGYGHVVAYVSGTLGTLIGADLLNLRIIPKLGAPIASIGGAGTFDGIFLAGIMAVVIVF